MHASVPVALPVFVGSPARSDRLDPASNFGHACLSFFFRFFFFRSDSGFSQAAFDAPRIKWPRVIFFFFSPAITIEAVVSYRGIERRARSLSLSRVSRPFLTDPQCYPCFMKWLSSSSPRSALPFPPPRFHKSFMSQRRLTLDCAYRSLSRFNLVRGDEESAEIIDRC